MSFNNSVKRDDDAAPTTCFFKERLEQLDISSAPIIIDEILFVFKAQHSYKAHNNISI